MANTIRDTYKYEAWRTGPLGTVNGTFHHHTDLTNGNANVQGDVRCFTIIGNRARIGGVVTRSNNPSLPVGRNSYVETSLTTRNRAKAIRVTPPVRCSARNAELYCAFGLPYPESPLDKTTM